MGGPRVQRPSAAQVATAKKKWRVLTDPWRRPQLAMLESLKNHRITICTSANGFGKTFAAVRIATGCCLGLYDWCPLPADVMLVGLGQKQARASLQKYIKRFWPRPMIRQSTTRDGLTETMDYWPLQADAAYGSHMDVMTVGMGEDMHQGSRRSLIVNDEEPSPEIFEEQLYRYADSTDEQESMTTRILFTMTPTHGAESWVKQTLVDHAKDLDVGLVEASVFENGVEPCEWCGRNWDQWAAALQTRGERRGGDNRSDWFRRQVEAMKKAKWSHAEGACGRCWTYGTTPKYKFENMRSNLLLTSDPRRQAMRFLGSWSQLSGTDAFTQAQKQALRAYAAGIEARSTGAGERQTAAPVPTHRYFMGVDASRGTGNDESVFCVIDAETRHQVYVWGDADAKWTEYIGDIVDMAARYNDATVWVEWASGGEGIMPLLMANPVVRLYARTPADRRYASPSDGLGFNTNQRSRSRILTQFISAVQLGLVEQEDGACVVQPNRDGALYLTDPKTVDQACRLYYNADADDKIEVSGGRDDRIMAAAGAWEAWMRDGGYSAAIQDFVVEDRPTYLDFLKQFGGAKAINWR